MRLPALGRFRRVGARRIGHSETTISARRRGQTRSRRSSGVDLAVNQQFVAFVAALVLPIVLIATGPGPDPGDGSLRLIAALVWALTSASDSGDRKRPRRRI
ncbi:hypothetical protein F7Q99_36630 [Streptomyces kaniharaensis]|uniref:Uncharacterized protein n=1 Tax=Streptomyces kaniharaensis TaxID=212423 RepID=A0A6N7L412_9ACTN|nr:hypothetical protein [Streptomyces kaniharaensis]MQS17567.1 hypothetical protein [Streptomyces kaniharaensis]